MSTIFANAQIEYEKNLFYEKKIGIKSNIESK